MRRKMLRQVFSDGDCGGTFNAIHKLYRSYFPVR